MSRPVVLERVSTPRGELVLRRDGTQYEIISNGTFLMDTRDGGSERRLVCAALERHPAPTAVLVGGLGMGTSLRQALTDGRVARIDVVEVEPTLVEWHRRHLVPASAGALGDPRVRLVIGDVADHLAGTDVSYDVISLDVDNGPGWTVTDANAALYGDDGTALLASRLRGDGILSVWSAARAPAYQAVLDRHFARVEVEEIMVARGEPDVVLVASSPRGVRRRDGTSDRS